VEAALVTPFLIILFISVAQFGFAFYVQATIQSAVRAAIRDVSISAAGVAPTGSFAACDNAAVTAGSVGEIVCEYLNSTDSIAANSSYEVLADGPFTYDPDNTVADDEIDDMYRVYARIPLSSVVFIDYNGFLTGGRYLEAYAVMQLEP
jgi:hypothetical protein